MPGTRSEIKNGKYTGKLAGPFCYGEGKVLAIEQLAKERGYDLAKSVAYSDSISDLPFMQAVGNAVAINADLPLTEFAIEQGWRVVETRGTRSALPKQQWPCAKQPRNLLGPYCHCL